MMKFASNHSIFNRGDFISYKSVNQFQYGFGILLDKLTLYCHSNPPGVGELAGMKLIRRLEQLETDDDFFPEYEIRLIRDLIGEY